MMLDTSAYPYTHQGQPFGQSHAQPFAQPFGGSLGQPYGQLFGQPFGASLGQPYGQPFGQLYGQPSSQPTPGVPLQVAQLAALQSLCAQFGPLVALQLAWPQAIGALSHPGLAAGLPLGGWPVPFGIGSFGAPVAQPHGYPIGQPTSGWLQSLFGQGIPGPVFAPRMPSGGIGAFGGGFAPFQAVAQPAYVG